MANRFWGEDTAVCETADTAYPGITDPVQMYEALTHVWCEDTCAPRMRKDWSQDNMTLGQCSVTAFLVQDIFGGRVFGILLPDGNYHCFNEVGDVRFDLTSAQFPEGELDYSVFTEQFREVHFAGEEKRLRYELLKRKLKDHCMQANG